MRSLKAFTHASLIVVAVLAFAVTAGAQNFTSPVRVDTAVALERGGTVSLSIHYGRVNIVGVQGSLVRIRGTVEQGGMEIRSRSSGVSINTELDGRRRGRADLDVEVPTGSNIVFEGFSAPLSMRGVKGEAKIENLSGNVEVSDAVGEVAIETVSGAIALTRANGNVRAEAVSGAVALADVTGDIETESVSGRVTITGARSKSVQAETVSGAIGYSGIFDPAGNYVFKSHSGRLTLGVPRDAGATVSLQTFSGYVDSEFPVTLESGRSRMGHESRFEFRIGNGRSRIVAETFSGNIKIQRTTTNDERE